MNFSAADAKLLRASSRASTILATAASSRTWLPMANAKVPTVSTLRVAAMGGRVGAASIARRYSADCLASSCAEASSSCCRADVKEGSVWAASPRLRRLSTARKMSTRLSTPSGMPSSWSGSGALEESLRRVSRTEAARPASCSMDADAEVLSRRVRSSRCCSTVECGCSSSADA